MKRLIPFLALLVCCQFVNGAGFKISELPPATTAASTNLLPIVTSSTETSSIMVGNLLTNLLTQAVASTLYQGTNANLTGWAAIPATSQGVQNTLGQVYQATNANLTALASNPGMYQATNATLTRLQGIGAGASGDVLFRDATGWTNLAKSTDGLVLKLTSGFPSWESDNVAAGGFMSQTVSNNVVSSGLLAVDSTKTNAVAATAANVTSALGFTPQNGSANLTNWSALSTNELTALLTEAEASALYQATNANLTGWAGIAATSQGIQNTLGQVYQATNAALTALASNPAMYQATNANLTAWSALATSAKQDADADLTGWAAISTNALPSNFVNSGTTNGTLPGTFRVDGIVVTNDVSADSITLSGDLSATTLYLSGLVPGYVELDANTNLVNVSAGEQTMFSRLGGIGAGTAGDILYRDSTGWTNLAKGADNKVLKLTSGYPAWETDIDTDTTANWTASGSTNQTSAGIASLHGLVVTNSITLNGSTMLTRQSAAPVTLTYADPVVTDASLGCVFRITLTGSPTLANPSNGLDGQRVIWEIIQDGSGSKTITLGAKFALGTDITAVTLTSTASKRDFLTAIYNSSADKWYVTGFVKGY